MPERAPRACCPRRFLVQSVLSEARSFLPARSRAARVCCMPPRSRRRSGRKAGPRPNEAELEELAAAMGLPNSVVRDQRVLDGRLPDPVGLDQGRDGIRDLLDAERPEVAKR